MARGRKAGRGQGSKNKKVISEMLSEVHSTAVQLVSVARFPCDRSDASAFCRRNGGSVVDSNDAF
jgi:hypothetical protein